MDGSSLFTFCKFRFGVVIVAFPCIVLGIVVPPPARFSSSDECVMPGGVPGTCKALAECEPLLRMLINARSRPRPWMMGLLRMSHCGFKGKDPIVCCQVAVRPKDPRANESSPLQPPNKQPLDNLFSQTCGYIQTLDKVTGGSPVMMHEFPWMALIGYQSSVGVDYRCGGTLISSRYVLTAAHCVTALKDIHPVLVRLGEHDLISSEDCDGENDSRSSVEEIPIEDLVPHPDFNKNRLQNDIALIRLARTVKFVDYIRPICLPLKGKFSELMQHEKAVVAGWGATELGTRCTVLRKVSLPFFPLTVCAEIYKNRVRVTENHICAGGADRKDACNGDSGGPLQVLGMNPAGQPAYIQQGVISFGPRTCGTKGMPGVYTRVDRYLEWIAENIKD